MYIVSLHYCHKYMYGVYFIIINIIVCGCDQHECIHLFQTSDTFNIRFRYNYCFTNKTNGNVWNSSLLHTIHVHVHLPSLANPVRKRICGDTPPDQQKLSQNDNKKKKTQTNRRLNKHVYKNVVKYLTISKNWKS